MTAFKKCIFFPINKMFNEISTAQRAVSQLSGGLKRKIALKIAQINLSYATRKVPQYFPTSDIDRKDLNKPADPHAAC